MTEQLNWTWPSNSIPRSICKRTEDIYQHNNLYTYVCSNIIQYSQKSGNNLNVHQLLNGQTHMACPFLLAIKEWSTDARYNGLSRWHSSKESTCQCKRHRRCGFSPWVRKIPWRRKWQPTPVFLPGIFHGQRSLAGYCPWRCKESDTTERLTTCYNISKSWKHYAEWKKPDTKDRVSYDSIYMKISE